MQKKKVSLRLKTVEDAKKYIRKLKFEAERERKKDLLERVEEVNKVRREKKYETLSGKQKLKEGIEWSIEDNELDYSKNWHRYMPKRIKSFCDEVQKDIDDKADNILREFRKQLANLLGELKELKYIGLKVDWICLKISEVRLEKLNELGEKGWKFSFEYNDKVYLSRLIGIRNVKKGEK